MTSRIRNLPDYLRPPLTEVALSVQFDSIDKLLTPQLGLLWAEFRDRFPVTEEQPPIAPQVEHFGKGPPARNVPPLQVMEKPETPRCWFLNQLGNELVQVQKDRFVVNWRKIGEESQYPRYEQLRERFRSDFGLLQKFVEREKLGELRIAQCEVTYVNHILAGKGWDRHGELDRVLSLWDSSQRESFLPEAEEIRFASRYVFSDKQGQPIGRLHLNLQPAFLKKDGAPILILTLIARGKPLGEGIEGALAFLDTGRKWIVRGFTSITTESMHQIWGRLDAK
jgi:uncharacterized protein (TIGR04255 family)